ncbi:MAG: 30S ribosomal protein S3 [Nitrososphaeraceae archaeon]|nr:30S ribosomal protein S3 [Nitrososphaeraceae archaeon]
MNTAKNLMFNNYKNMELDSYLKERLRESGYGGVEIQKTPIGTRITLYVTRPGLVIGRKGVGIKDLTTKLESSFGLNNPQVSVMEIEIPELNAKIMANRIAQLIERGTAFRRAAIWTLNTVMNAGALGTEVSIAGKLRSERAHFEKHSAGIIPKSGELADRVVKVAVTNVLTKMGLMGIQLRVVLKNEIPTEFQLNEEINKENQSIETTEDSSSTSEKENEQNLSPSSTPDKKENDSKPKKQEKTDISNKSTHGNVVKDHNVPSKNSISQSDHVMKRNDFTNRIMDKRGGI